MKGSLCSGESLRLRCITSSSLIEKSNSFNTSNSLVPAPLLKLQLKRQCFKSAIFFLSHNWHMFPSIPVNLGFKWCSLAGVGNKLLPSSNKSQTQLVWLSLVLNLFNTTTHYHHHHHHEKVPIREAKAKLRANWDLANINICNTFYKYS